MKKFLIFILILILIILALGIILYFTDFDFAKLFEKAIPLSSDTTYNIDNEFSITIKTSYNLKKQEQEDEYKLLLYSEDSKFEFYISELANISNYPLIRIAEADKNVFHNNWELTSNISEVEEVNINEISGYGYSFDHSDETGIEYTVISNFIEINNKVYVINAEFPKENYSIIINQWNDILNSLTQEIK